MKSTDLNSTIILVVGAKCSQTFVVVFYLISHSLLVLCILNKDIVVLNEIEIVF